MFCGEITTNRRFRVFRIADLKTSQTRRFRGQFAKHGNKNNNSFRNIISHRPNSAAKMSGPEMSVTDMFTSTASTTATSKTCYDIDSSDINSGPNKVADKDSYYTC